MVPKTKPTQDRIDAELVEEDYELQPREDVVEFDPEAMEEAQLEARKSGAPHAGVISSAQSSQLNPQVSEEEQFMDLAPVVFGPPAYGSPDPETSQSRLMPLEQHPLNPENLPEGHPAAISEDYGEPGTSAVEGDVEASNAEANATQGAIDLANENSVDLRDVQGTGEDGRVTKPDVENYLAEQEETA
jgi:pyruvate/2-oxoglutarate dehydrogenase complex dihydrolipoamide acyltransferase (E2) component